ncbi:hypothetical protein Pelo_37 [Pelomyxa schiedti]|nr:hypothetical protein Pelo_37 [Pelomyxa schiedti]
MKGADLLSAAQQQQQPLFRRDVTPTSRNATVAPPPHRNVATTTPADFAAPPLPKRQRGVTLPVTGMPPARRFDPVEEVHVPVAACELHSLPCFTSPSSRPYTCTSAVTTANSNATANHSNATASTYCSAPGGVGLVSINGGDAMDLMGHAVPMVSITGIVVSCSSSCYETKFTFMVDDGTGIVECNLWLKNMLTPLKDQATSLLSRGLLVTVLGKIRIFRGVRQLTVTHFQVETDPNSETFYWVQMIQKRKSMNL